MAGPPPAVAQPCIPPHGAMAPGRIWDKHTALTEVFHHLWGSAQGLGTAALPGLSRSPGGSHFAAVTNPVLISLFPPQGVPVTWCQTTDDSLWASPIHVPTGQGCTLGTQAVPAATRPLVSLPCGAAAEPQPVWAEARRLWKAAAHRFHPQQHSSPSCPKVCAFYPFELGLFFKVQACGNLAWKFLLS